MKTGKTLAVCVIAKNESKTLPRLVESFQGFYDQFVVVDTGSSDNTVEVAKSLGLEVYEHPWNNSFCEARNKACSYARTDWIFCPDCDEVIRNPENFYKFLKEVHPNHNQVALNLHLSWDDKGNVTCDFFAQRCFRRGTHEWKGHIHEYLAAINGHVTSVAQCRDSWFEHHPVSEKDRSFYIHLLRKHANENPDDARYQYYMGREAVAYGLYVEALGYLQRCVEKHHWDEERAQARIFMSDCYQALGDKDKAKEQLALSIKESPRRRDAFFRMAEIYRLEGDYEKAANWYSMCVSIPKSNINYLHDEKLYGCLPYLRMAYCYWYLGNLRLALEAFNVAKNIEPKNSELEDNSHFFDLPKVSIIIPTRFRDELLNETIKAINSDLDSYPNIEVIIFRDEDKEPLGCVKSVNKAVKKATGDYICFLGNDTIPKPGWLLNAVFFAKEKYNGEVMVGFNNEIQKGIAQHFIIHKNLLKELDYNEGREPSDYDLFYEGYHHSFCDTELLYQMAYKGRYRWIETAVVHHRWYDKRLTSPGLAPREKTEDDVRVQRLYEQDETTFNKRYEIIKKTKIKFGAIVMAHLEREDYSRIDQVINMLKASVDDPKDIVVVMGDPIYPLSPEDREKVIEFDKKTMKKLQDKGVTVFWSNSQEEHTRRNEARNYSDADFFFIVDSDELYPPGGLDRIKEIILNNIFFEAFYHKRLAYWKTPEWQLLQTSPEIFLFCIRRYIDSVEARTVGRCSGILINSDDYCHHFSYVKPDDIIEMKVKRFASPDVARLHPVVPGWYDNVWKKWTPEKADEFFDLHPTHPSLWKKAVRITPPEWFDSAYRD